MTRINKCHYFHIPREVPQDIRAENLTPSPAQYREQALISKWQETSRFFTCFQSPNPLSRGEHYYVNEECLSCEGPDLLSVRTSIQHTSNTPRLSETSCVLHVQNDVAQTCPVLAGPVSWEKKAGSKGRRTVLASWSPCKKIISCWKEPCLLKFRAKRIKLPSVFMDAP